MANKAVFPADLAGVTEWAHRAVVLLACGLAIGGFAMPASGQQPGSPLHGGAVERGAVCEAIAEAMVEAHEVIGAGTTLKRYAEVLHTQIIGSEDDRSTLALFLIGATIADHYVSTKQSADSLRADFLRPCMTTDKHLGTVMSDLFLAKLPEDHALRAAVAGTADTARAGPSADLGVKPGTTLSAEHYRAILGEDAEGTRAVAATFRRSDAELTSCSLEFSHLDYDDIYSQGRSVALRGILDISVHPTAPLVAFVKIRGSDVMITVPSEGPPSSRDIVFDIANFYPTIDGEPIVRRARHFECEDPESVCQVNFQWELVARAIADNSVGIAYRRAGGRSDVPVHLDWSEPEGGAEARLEFSQCFLELATRVKSEMEAARSAASAQN